MTTNIYNIELLLSQNMFSSCCNLDLLTYSTAIKNLTNGNVNSVSTYSNLPNYLDHIDELWYIESEKLIYISVTDNGWLPLYNSEIGRNLWGWGRNASGQLGDETAADKCVPVREISSSTTWSQINIAGSNSIAIKCDNTLWVWGNSSNGRLGNGTTTPDRCSPVREISSSCNWCFSAIGIFNGFGIKNDNSIWGWGRNIAGSIGNGTTVDTCSPVREITSSINWCYVNQGNSTTIALKTDGTLWSWGCNLNGRLGDGTTVDKCSPVREISSDRTWCSAKAGCLHSVALKTDGSLWSWGENNTAGVGLGSLADGTTVNRCSPVREFIQDTSWCSVSAAGFHTIGIKTDGSLWSWGYGNFGRLGDGTTVSKCSPVREITSSKNWVFGESFIGGWAAIKTDGSLWTVGCGQYGALGTGDTTPNRCSPVREASLSNNWIAVTGGSGQFLVALKSN